MIRPASNYVLLDVKNKETSSVIIIPDKYKKKERKGIILAVGRYVSQDLKVGDEVYFSPGGIKETEEGLLIPERSLELKKK
jgi:co-chaperonin GroES (HSP10)